MQDGDHDALNFPVLGDASSVPTSLDAGSNKLLVVATLAALIIAGSAIVYRTIPLSASRTSSSSGSGQDDAVHKQKKMKMTEPLQLTQKRAEREEGDAGVGSYDDANGTPASPTRPTTEEFESKESKSSRSKDRRRRGKDPVKEMLKSEKKSRGLGGASPTLSNRDYTTFKPPSIKEDPTPSSPSSSLFADSQLNDNGNGKNAKAKRTGQREKSNVGPDDTTQQARGNSLGSFSEIHSRATSESISASESTQRLNVVDGLQSHLSPSHPSTSDPSSSLASDDRPGRPQSSLSVSTTSSTGSRQVGNVDDQEDDDALEWETIRREKHHKRQQASLSQARPSRSSLASDDEYAHHDTVVVIESSSTSTSVPQPMKSASRASPSVETTATATGVLNSEGMSPATSPGGSLASIPHNHADETGEARDKYSHSIASSASPDTAKTSSSKTDKTGKGSQKVGSSSTASTDAHDPWDWDGAGNVPSSSSSNIGEADRNPPKEKDKGQTKARDNQQKPPRLQQGGVVAGKAPSFSSVAASRLPPSSTHPTSLYSPTSSSFGQSSGMTASVSAATAQPSSGRDSPYSLSEVKERDEEEEEEAFTFPTLNPTTSVAGSSRTRSSLVDNNINNNINSNTTHYNIPSTSRRAPTPRRPPTPSSRSNSTPPPHTSSSSPHPHGSTSSLNSPTHPGSANGNGMPALSMQTQLASLRGALEAARLREEKNKQDMDTYVKDLDALRWENANWRRGQQDLQMQIRHLTHQLQTYAALVASVSPQLQLQQLQQQQANGTGTSANPTVPPGSTPPPSTTTAPNGYGGASSGSTSIPATPQLPSASASGVASTQQPQTQQQTQATHPTPPPLHILSNLQMNGISSPVGVGGVLSPVSMTSPPPPLLMGMPPGASPSPFYPYPMAPHPHAPPHPFMIHPQQLQYMQQQYQQQQQQGSAQPSPHQANVFSNIFPPGPVLPPLMSPQHQHQYSAYVASQQASTSTIPIPYGSRSSSRAAGSSSAGSMSPDINGSPSPGGGLNGNRRARTRTLTANDGRPAAWEDVAEGWEDEDRHDEFADNEGNDNAAVNDEYGEEGGFNEVLADAILKRPGSIRVRSSSRRGKLNMDQSAVNDEENNTSQMTNERVEVVEQLTEFTFPSLSNIGNVLYRSDVVAVNGGLSSSSSSSASPAPMTPDDVVVDDSVPRELDPAALSDPDVAAAEHEPAHPISEEMPSVSPESTTESETTPREEPLVKAAEPPTNLTEPRSEEAQLRPSQDSTEQANSSSVEH